MKNTTELSEISWLWNTHC